MQNPATDLVSTVRRTITQMGSFTPGENIVVAVSGGPDSTALLHSLAILCEEWNVRLIGAHLNHGFRQMESVGDADYVRALCASLGVPYYGETVDVPTLRKRRHLSAQAAAREVRHAFLRRVATEVGATRIALGHNRDDRIETVLLNILRGSGLDGLVGLAVSEPPLIRPLLEVPRSEIEAYCALHGLNPRHDSSNSKTDYRRNRVRAELLPHLASYYNQCIGDSLLRLSEIAAADTDFLNALAHQHLKDLTRSARDAELDLDAAALAQLPLALRRRVLRFAIEVVRGDLRDVSMEATEGVLNALMADGRKTVRLPFSANGSIEVKVEWPSVRIRSVAAAAEALPWSCTIDIPGTTALTRVGIVLDAKLYGSVGEAVEAAGTGLSALVYPLTEIAFPLTVRSWQAGDRMRPQGLGGTKKLQDLFTDRKIRGEERMRFPVLADAAGQILAVVGVQASDAALRQPRAHQEAVDSGAYVVLTWREERY